mmetsp:Transcript_929/g.2966  ORF Transcript_929/g.2966 Transcript_929/m.2966 type:complete len:128 (-) Transcript_929:82-465(-)
MTLTAAFARWARPRNAHLSSFGRRLAVDLKLVRGIAAAPALRLAGEPRPLGGWVEQRGAIPIGTGRLLLGEASDDLSDPTAAQIVAAVLNDIAEPCGDVCFSFSEMIDLSVLGICNPCVLPARIYRV